MKSKIRLWAEYCLIALVVALAALTVWNFVQRLHTEKTVTELQGSLKAANDRVAQVEQANAVQEQALKTLQSYREVDGVVLRQLADGLETLRIRNAATHNKILILERNNEEVRRYLDATVPPELGCVLDGTCEAGGADGSAVRPPARSAPGSVRPPATRAKPDDARHRRQQ